MTLRRDRVQSPGSWADRAACRGASLEVPAVELKRTAVPGRVSAGLIARYCDRCEVLDECRAWALTSPDPAAGHIAGGLTPHQRSRARRTGGDA